MSCRIINNPITGEEMNSALWNQISSEVLNDELADHLFAKTRTEQFKSWFGDIYNQGEAHSQVVNEVGEPLLVYHSSKSNFDEFDSKKSTELGFHFGSEKAAFDRYSTDSLVYFDDYESGEGQISKISAAQRRIDLREAEIFVNPYYLNIRNMVEGVDYLEAADPENLSISKEEYYDLYDANEVKNEFENPYFNHEFRLLVIAFYNKGSINYDQAKDIMESGDKSKLRSYLGNPDGYWYNNALEDKGAVSYVVFDSNNIKSLYNVGEYSQDDNIFYNLDSDDTVNFTLKVINALQKTPRKTYPSNSISGFYNDLAKQGAPKQQIELVKDYIASNNIQEINVPDLIAGLASEISYTIEINTAKTSRVLEDTPTATTVYRNFDYKGEKFTKNDELDFDGEYKEIYRRNDKQIKKAEFIEFAKKAEQIRIASPTQHYANLTVPGGTNYTENEIATPAIVPSIKGHAQFATDNGIGWFRSDDKENKIVGWKEEDDFLNSETAQYNPITKDDRIIFGHPTIGKSYLKQKGNNDFITLDDDYADEVNTFIDANRGTETRQEYKGRKPKEYNEFMLNLFDRLKAQAKKEGKRLFVSNTNILKERMSEFDKVITIPKDEFKKRFDARGATYGFEDWKSDIDATVAKVDKSKVISTTGYLSDLLEGNPKTRRILEVQSDLFQKGRSEKNLADIEDERLDVLDILRPLEKELIDYVNSNELYYYGTNKSLISATYSKTFSGERIDVKLQGERGVNSKTLWLNRREEEYQQYVLPKSIVDKIQIQIPNIKNQFLQLLNKDNNWVTFFVKSVIQDSAKKGYEKVLFPSGNTASKVEGHTTLEEFKKQKEDRIKELENKLKEISTDEFFNKTYKIVDNQIHKKESTKEYPNLAFTTKVYSEKEAKEVAYEFMSKSSKQEIAQLKQELERVEIEGFGALKPIYNFYENTVANILKKQGYNPERITDEYGNGWYEIAITDKAFDTILLNLKQQGYYQSIPENILGILSKNSVVTRVTRDLEDRWYFVRGLNLQAQNIQDNLKRYHRFMSMNNLNEDMFVFDNTKTDKAPFLKLNSNFNLKDTIEENTEKIHKNKYEAIINFFQDKFGIAKDRINYITKAEFKKQFPEVYKENVQSVYYNGKFYFFTHNLTSDITVEELLHPFIYTVKDINPQLFNNLLEEAQRHYPKLNAKIQSLYSDRSKFVRDQELVTQALSRVFNNVYENEEPTSFLETIKDFIYWLRNILKNLFNEYSTGKKINIPIDKLPVQTSLYEIAKILNATDTQFDIIFPENTTMYSLEENNIDFNRTIETILSDKRVATKINEIFVKLPNKLKEIKSKLNNTINEQEKKNLQGIIKNIEQLDNQESQNVIAFQLKGIVASIQLSNELVKNLTAMSRSDNNDSIKLSYYMSVYKTAKAMDGFKDLIIDLKNELTSNLILDSKDINVFINMLDSAIGAEATIERKIQEIVVSPLLNKLVENSEYSYQSKLQELKTGIANIEEQMAKTQSQSEKEKLSNKAAPLRRELKAFLEKAPTKENLEKILTGFFRDANSLSHIFEAKIANGNPLVATLQNIITDIYDSAGRNMLPSKNDAQTMSDKYSKATNMGLRDMDKRYEQIRDTVALPTEIILGENNNPLLDDNGNHQFNYINQDTLLSNIDNSYITQYLELEMVKDFYLDKHRENTYTDVVDEAIFAKYQTAKKALQDFIDLNAQKEYTQEIYDFKAIMDQVIGDKTLREITGDLYNQLDEQNINLESASDTNARLSILNRIQDINIELKAMRSLFTLEGVKKEGDALKIAEELTKYNKLRSTYYESTLSESAKTRYEFDKAELEKNKDQYLVMGAAGEALYRNNLNKIEQKIISPDYFTALEDISSALGELQNELAEIATTTLSQFTNQDIIKQRKKDVYAEIRELAKPYRDEDGVIDGIALIKRHPEVGIQIRDLQQYLEDLKYETANIGSLSKAESTEIADLSKKEGRSETESNRLTELLIKKQAFSEFRKQNKALFKQIQDLYKQLHDLTLHYNTEYYTKAVEQEFLKYKSNAAIITQAVDFIKDNPKINIENVIYEKGGVGRNADTWYRIQVTGKKVEYFPLDNVGNSGYNEILDIVSSYIAKITMEDSQWWKDNHYKAYSFDTVNKVWNKMDFPTYIWVHQEPRDAVNFIETKPAKAYHKFDVRNSYINEAGKTTSLININFDTTYRGIPLPKGDKFKNKRYSELKDKGVLEFLTYFTNKYLGLQEIYEAKGNSVKMGFVLPAVAKTSGENQVNTTNKLLSFDGTFAEIFRENASATDTDTSYLVGGGQSNNKAIPIRFVGKMDTKRQTKNIIAAILLFEYHSSLYKSLNETLPIFEASQLLASNADVMQAKNYADKLSFTKKIFNIFKPKKTKEEILETKNIEKSVLSKSIDEVLDVFVYGQRMKPQILNMGPLGNVDLAKVSSGILGFAAQSIFVGNVISAINNSLSTRLQIIINAGLKTNSYSLGNIRNAQAKAPKYTKDMLSDWTKLGNKSLIGQVLDYFAFTAENPGREITNKSEFTALKNKMEFLTSPKQMSEFEVLFIQFLTVADATPIKINGQISKLSNIEDIFQIENGKLKVKDGVELTKEQERIFRNKYQSLARKVAGAYRTTEISSIETNWAGKAGMFLRRYFVGMATNRFQGTRFSIQEGDIYTGYQREVIRNIRRLFSEYKGNMSKYWETLSDKEKASHFKMLREYGLLLVLVGLFSLLGGNDDKEDLKKNSWVYNMQLVALLRAKSELQQFTLVGIDDLIRIGKNPFMAFQTLGNVLKTIGLIDDTIFGWESGKYQQNTGLHKKGDSKLFAQFLKTIGYTGVTWSPEDYIINFRNAQNR